MGVLLSLQNLLHRKNNMSIIFYICVAIGIYEGLKKVSDTHNGIIIGTKPSTNILDFLLKN